MSEHQQSTAGTQPSDRAGQHGDRVLLRQVQVGDQDQVRWAGLTVKDVGAGVALVQDRLTALHVDGVEYLMDLETPEMLAAHRAEARGLFLLPGFDELVLGYGDRGAVLDPKFAERIVPGRNGVFRPTVVHDGRIVGTWQSTGRGTKRTMTATPFTAFPGAVDAALPRLGARPALISF